MNLLISNSTDPYFNLATEEYLLKNSSADIIFLYRNRPCIIIGKHQNAMAEVNYRFVNENNLPVVRRISGGGTVYHDEGNINFTFLQNGEEGNLVNFKTFIAPVAEFLKQYGIPAEVGPRNDILINGLKVSGNAEHIYRKRTLHHGTLLFSSELTNLKSALHVEPGKYNDRAVKSVRSKVTNIRESLTDKLDVHQFFKALSEYLFTFYNATPFELKTEAVYEINQSSGTKYTSWDWNYGYSPNYVFKNTIITNYLNLNIEFEVEKGIIKQSSIAGNLEDLILHELNKSILNQEHAFFTLSKNSAIANLQSIANIDTPDFFWSFF